MSAFQTLVLISWPYGPRGSVITYLTDACVLVTHMVLTVLSDRCQHCWLTDSETHRYVITVSIQGTRRCCTMYIKILTYKFSHFTWTLFSSDCAKDGLNLRLMAKRYKKVKQKMSLNLNFFDKKDRYFEPWMGDHQRCASSRKESY